jgi:hypothetical protein
MARLVGAFLQLIVANAANKPINLFMLNKTFREDDNLLGYCAM